MSKKLKTTGKSEKPPDPEAHEDAKAKFIGRVRAGSFESQQEAAVEFKAILAKEPEGCTKFISDVYQASQNQDRDKPNRLSLVKGFVVGGAFALGKLSVIGISKLLFVLD